jgi:hypothetical protein
MTLDYTIFGQVKTTMINYVDKILTAFFDKADPKGNGTKTSAASENFSELTKTVRSSSQTKLWTFTTWWPRLCMPPNMLGQIPAQLLHS